MSGLSRAAQARQDAAAAGAPVPVFGDHVFHVGYDKNIPDTKTRFTLIANAKDGKGRGFGGITPFIGLSKKKHPTGLYPGPGGKIENLSLWLDQLAEHDMMVYGGLPAAWPFETGGDLLGGAGEQKKHQAVTVFTCRVLDAFRQAGRLADNCVRKDSASFTRRSKCPQLALGNIMTIAEYHERESQILAAFGMRGTKEPETCWEAMETIESFLVLLEEIACRTGLGPHDDGGYGMMGDLSHLTIMLKRLGALTGRQFLRPDFDFKTAMTSGKDEFVAAMLEAAKELRHWHNYFHQALNDGTEHGVLPHPKTGKHCFSGDPNGIFDVVEMSELWLTDPENANWLNGNPNPAATVAPKHGPAPRLPLAGSAPKGYSGPIMPVCMAFDVCQNDQKVINSQDNADSMATVLWEAVDKIATHPEVPVWD